MIRYLTLDGRWMFSEYLEHWGRDLAARGAWLLRYEQLVGRTQFDAGTYVFTTFDEMHGSMRRFVDALAERLRDVPGIRIFNDPARVLRRFDLHQALWRLGRNTFRSFRANGDWSAARYPLFVRSEDAHDGAFSPLLRSEAEVDAWIGRAIALGRKVEDLLVVEFCDTAGGNGVYRKYAAFNVGGTIVARGLSHARNWMLKFAGSDLSMETAREELAYVTNNPHEAELREIFAIANIEYGRIDYSLLEGRVQTWEINLNPTIGRGSRPSKRRIDPELRAVREEAKQVFYARFNAAWAAVAAESPGCDVRSIEIRIDPLVIDAARAELRRSWRTRKGFLEACLRTARPLMKTSLAPLLRVLYRGPQRVVRASAGPLFRVLGRRARARSSDSA